MAKITPAVLDKLCTFDTPTICNIIELFEVRPRNEGYMNGTIQADFPDLPPIAGFAATATLRTSVQAAGAEICSVQDQVERFGALSGPPLVVFQDLDEPAAAATFGEGMCTVYQMFGAVGLITNGAGRDLDHVRALNFPTFSNGAICSHGYHHIPAIHVPVQVGGLTIAPDTLLHADRNGVTTIPHEIAAEVADAGYEYVAAESVVLEALRLEPVSLRAYAAAREEAAARIEALRQQLSRAR